jgi:hypothetical protein
LEEWFVDLGFGGARRRRLPSPKRPENHDREWRKLARALHGARTRFLRRCWGRAGIPNGTPTVLQGVPGNPDEAPTTSQEAQSDAARGGGNVAGAAAGTRGRARQRREGSRRNMSGFTQRCEGPAGVFVAVRAGSRHFRRGIARERVLPGDGHVLEEEILHPAVRRLARRSQPMRQGIGKIAPEWADERRATGGTSRWPRRESRRGAQTSGRQ